MSHVSSCSSEFGWIQIHMSDILITVLYLKHTNVALDRGAPRRAHAVLYILYAPVPVHVAMCACAAADLGVTLNGQLSRTSSSPVCMTRTTPV